MHNILKLIGREEGLFADDIAKYETQLADIISGGSFLVIGGAGTIGQAVTKELFARDPRKLHVVDISENNLTELVRDLRSSYGYTTGQFQTFSIDVASPSFEALMAMDGKYDYILNLSALKHVRSEKDPFTLMRLIQVNILNTQKTIAHALDTGTKKYFAVSTDKAANPVNLMGASKKIMENYLWHYAAEIPISTARFANVAFSDGSLLHGFNQRIAKHQPIAAPSDIKRYFVTPKESGQLCLLSCLLGVSGDIFFPKLTTNFSLTLLSDIVERYVHSQGYEPIYCSSEDEARASVPSCIERGAWPCFLTPSNTTGEKSFEEFYTDDELLDMTQFQGIGVVKNTAVPNESFVTHFNQQIEQLLKAGSWSKLDIVRIFENALPEFKHVELGQHLDNKM